MVLVGHCGSPKLGGYNCVTVLRRGGDEAWTQAKVNSYDLKNYVIRRDHLELPLLASEEAAYRERLELPLVPEMTVADTPYGRLMIAICEDVSHLEPSLLIAVQAGVTHLIVPLLDKGLGKEDHWCHQRARTLARGEPRCTTIVATSAFLERHTRSFNPNSPGVDDPVTVL
jgi:predicted amidohydrolase